MLDAGFPELAFTILAARCVRCTCCRLRGISLGKRFGNGQFTQVTLQFEVRVDCSLLTLQDRMRSVARIAPSDLWFRLKRWRRYMCCCFAPMSRNCSSTLAPHALCRCSGHCGFTMSAYRSEWLLFHELCCPVRGSCFGHGHLQTRRLVSQSRRQERFRSTVGRAGHGLGIRGCGTQAQAQKNSPELRLAEVLSCLCNRAPAFAGLCVCLCLCLCEPCMGPGRPAPPWPAARTSPLSRARRDSLISWRCCPGFRRSSVETLPLSAPLYTPHCRLPKPCPLPVAFSLQGLRLRS